VTARGRSCILFAEEAEADVTTYELVCARDGVATRLRCAECDGGICPACMVKTPVGYKCPSCSGELVERQGRRPATFVLAGVAVLVVLAGLTLLGGSDEPGADPVALETAPAEAAPTQQAMMGEEVRDGQLAFLIEDFTCAADGLPAGAAPRTADGKVCLLRATVRNVSSAPAMLLGRFQYLLDGQARLYGADQNLSAMAPENANRSLTEVNINPDVTVPIVLLYDIPGAVEPVEAQFKGNGRSRFGVNVRLQRRPG
jgi:hypothetical protein